MILLDANILLRALTWSDDPEIQKLCEIAAALIRQVERGEAEVIASDLLLAEVAFILAARAHYQLPISDAAARMATIVRLRGFRRRDKRSVLRALDHWSSQPELGFVDAMTAIQALRPGIELATFDRDFDFLTGINRWNWLEANGDTT